MAKKTREGAVSTDLLIDQYLGAIPGSMLQVNNITDQLTSFCMALAEKYNAKASEDNAIIFCTAVAATCGAVIASGAISSRISPSFASILGRHLREVLSKIEPEKKGSPP